MIIRTDVFVRSIVQLPGFPTPRRIRPTLSRIFEISNTQAYRLRGLYGGRKPAAPERKGTQA